MKIEKCPFCGGEASYRDDGRWEKVYDEGGAIVDVDISSPCVFVIECSCGAQIVSDESEDAVRAAWNRRSDAVPVVRCKDCKQYNTTSCSKVFGWCDKMNRVVHDDFYCANGAKMESEGST